MSPNTLTKSEIPSCGLLKSLCILEVKSILSAYLPFEKSELLMPNGMSSGSLLLVY